MGNDEQTKILTFIIGALFQAAKLTRSPQIEGTMADSLEDARKFIEVARQKDLLPKLP